MSGAETARARRRVAETSLALVQPGPSDADVASNLVAVLFAAAGPISFVDAARILEIPNDRLEDVCALLDRRPPAGLVLQRHAGSIQLTTAPAAAAVVERYLGAPPPVRLSRAALEALAVIAYRQPVTRGEIDSIRGVNSDSAVSTLLSRGLVSEVGRRETIGRPTLLATTPECLQYLGMKSMRDLPPLERPASVSDQPSNDQC